MTEQELRRTHLRECLELAHYALDAGQMSDCIRDLQSALLVAVAMRDQDEAAERLARDARLRLQRDAAVYGGGS